MNDVIKIALLGSGTVGGGVIQILEKNGSEIAQKVGKPVRITKVLVRNPEKYKDLLQGYQMVTSIEEITSDPDIAIVIELMGREHPAKEYMEAALAAGKNVITANKDVLAKYGKELFALAEEHQVDFMFEAAVGGGIPIIRPLKNCLAANHITSILGIVNGTTNYMLTKMTQNGMSYGEALKKAQDKGYAESDPTADVEGLDSARKIAILASIGFNMRISVDDVYVEGISHVDYCDIEYARDLGYIIKLLGVAKKDAVNGVSCCVYPVMLPKKHPLAGVNDVFNAVFVTGDAVGDCMFMGRGAGRFPTASAVCGDIIDVARNIRHHSTGRINCTCFEEKHLCTLDQIIAPCYIRLQVLDEPGVLATIATAFGKNDVSLKNVVQKALVEGRAELVVITHAVSELHLRKALKDLKALDTVYKICTILRVEDKDFE
jgi:homoserine dehydrogenase